MGKLIVIVNRACCWPSSFKNAIIYLVVLVLPKPGPNLGIRITRLVINRLSIIRFFIERLNSRVCSNRPCTRVCTAYVALGERPGIGTIWRLAHHLSHYIPGNNTRRSNPLVCHAIADSTRMPFDFYAACAMIAQYNSIQLWVIAQRVNNYSKFRFHDKWFSAKEDTFFLNSTVLFVFNQNCDHYFTKMAVSRHIYVYLSMDDVTLLFV